MEVVWQNPTTGATLEVGYFNFIPMTNNWFVPLGTPSEGAPCPVAGQFQVDANYMYICAPTSGHAFGSGTWKRSPIT
jgi:hypothetical protein